MPYTDNAGIRIHYEVEGTGPPLVLQHGFTHCVKDWVECGYVAALRPTYRLILVDARGHGDSDKPHDEDSYTLDRRVADVTAVLDSLGLEKAHFWGYSMGGYIGFGMAKYAPLGVLPANVRMSGFLPHRPVLERSALLISQAGHGLVMKGMHHGVPMVLIPWDRDQPGVAARAQALGIAEVIPRANASSLRVAEAIGSVLGDLRFANAAALHAARLQRQNPVQQACDLVLSLGSA